MVGRLGTGGVFLLLVAALASVALAAERRPSVVSPEAAIGVVVQVSGSEIFVDLGRARGAVAGDRMRVYRRVEVEHPVRWAPESSPTSSRS